MIIDDQVGSVAETSTPEAEEVVTDQPEAEDQNSESVTQAKNRRQKTSSPPRVHFLKLLKLNMMARCMKYQNG